MTESKQVLQKVTLEFNDCIRVLEGEAAENWIKRIDSNCNFAQSHNQNSMCGFDYKQ